jgi:hypothetical protein
MSSILEKISSYNIFNYLFPGAVFVFACEASDIFKIASDNVILALIIYYFAGMTISRIGSMILDPILMRLGWIKFSHYSDYLRATEKDAKIEIFIEVSNTYRTLGSMCLCLIAAFEGHAVLQAYSIPIGPIKLIGIIALACLFIFSYKKQIGFIRQRVDFQKRK